ncbi:MAG: hypothetical protein M3T49_03730 [Candidatus Eremiobacteraeota bacterium]|nr:hypothetical protein [Candidatus Eremiobacteraeota bacterium]
MICDKCKKETPDAVAVDEFVVCYDCALHQNFAAFAQDRRRKEKRRSESMLVRADKVNAHHRPIDHPAWMSDEDASSISAEIQELCVNNLNAMGPGSHVHGFYELGPDAAHHQVSIVFKNAQREVVVKTPRSSLRHRLYVKSCESLAAQLAAQL